jgi:adenylosuccinate lyase
MSAEPEVIVAVEEMLAFQDKLKKAVKKAEETFEKAKPISVSSYDDNIYQEFYQIIREDHATEELSSLLASALEDFVVTGYITKEKVLKLIKNPNNWKY